MNFDSSTKRWLAMALGPVFLLLNGKLGAGVDPETQRLTLEVIMAYFLASKGGETIIENARAKAASMTLTPTDIAAVLARANSEGSKLTTATVTTQTTPVAP